MTLGKLTVRTATSVKHQLELAEATKKDETRSKLYNRVKGVYASRRLGLCIYRNDELK